MSEDKKKKLITKEHLDSFFDAMDIDLRAILDERNVKQAARAAATPGLGECTEGVFEEKATTEELEISMEKTLRESEATVEEELKKKVNASTRKYDLPTFKTVAKEKTPIRLPSTSSLTAEDISEKNDE